MDLTGRIPSKKAAEILNVTPRWIIDMCNDPEKSKELGAVKKETGRVEWFLLESAVRNFKRRSVGRPRKERKERDKQLTF